MAGAKWSDFGSIWKTIREVDIAAIRTEAGHDVLVACVGDREALRRMYDLLQLGPDQYPTPWSALGLVPLDQVTTRERLIGEADLLIVALHAEVTLDAAELAGLARLEALSPRRRLLVLVGEPPASARSVLRRLDRGSTLVLRPRAADARDRLAAAVLDALPAGRRLAAARRLPGLRPHYAHRLTNEVSLSNGAFVVASGLPSLVPVLGIPIAAADTLVLTKNQALMVYRLALAFGAPPEFQKRMLEITPVIGAAVMWRQVAGGLVGLIPGYGIVPKTVVAFAGTWITGRAAELYYGTGLVSKDDLRRFSEEAVSRARAAAGEMARRARAARDRTTRTRRAGSRVRAGVRRLTPRRGKKAAEHPDRAAEYPDSPPAPPHRD
ncbi:MAG: hypothetical protein GX624_09405 [Actinobacteria bacterium]|nr:hypothetical protein [Actinomycetota bacterium]